MGKCAGKIQNIFIFIISHLYNDEIKYYYTRNDTFFIAIHPNCIIIRGEVKMYKKEKKLDFMPIGRAIKKAREAKGWTQEKLASLVDCTGRTIMYIENKGQHPSLDMLYQLATLLEISLDQYFHGDYEENELKIEVDMVLKTLTDKELVVIQSTAQGLKKAREMED